MKCFEEKQNKHALYDVGSMLPVNFERLPSHFGPALMRKMLGHSIIQFSITISDDPRPISLCSTIARQRTELELNLSAQYWEVEINLEGILELLPTKSDFMIN